MFLREAVKNAVEAKSDDGQWPFAILHVVQALELTFKAMLEKHHRLFIYEDIDKPTKTVSVSKAIERLSNRELGFSDITETEKKKISKAIELRNKITHFEFDCSAEYAGAKFAEVFGLVTFLQARHLDIELDALIDRKALYAIIEHEKSFDELHARALNRIREEKICSSLIWNCPECSEETFVAENGIDTCYLCRHSVGVTYCPQCKELLFADDLIDFSNLLDYSECEGRYSLENDFGYSEHVACPECLEKIKDDGQNKRLEEHNHWEEMENHLRGLY